MAELRIALGAAFDVASSSEVQASVDGGVDKILARMPDADHGLRLRPASSININPAATGTFVIDLGRPAPGTIWWVLEVIVTAADDHTAPAGTISAVYCGISARQVGATLQDTPPLGQLVRPAIAVPSVHAFSGEAWPVKDTENLSVIVYAPTTALATASAVATVMQLNASAVSINRLR